MKPLSPSNLMDQALKANRNGRFEDALDLMRQAVASSEGTPLECDARLRLGKMLEKGSPAFFEEALTNLNIAREKAARSGAVRQEAAAIHLLALYRRHQGLLDEAESLLASSPVQRITDAPGPEFAQWLHYRGLLAADRGQLANAERLCLRAHQIYQELNHLQGLAEVCTSLANLLLRRGKSRAALAFARQSLQQTQSLEDRYGQAISHGILGRIFLLQANYDIARDSFLKDLELSQTCRATRGITIALNSLGEIAIHLKQWDEARSRFEESLGVEGGRTNALFAQIGLARAHLGAGRLEQVESVLQSLVEMTDLANPSDEVIRLSHIDALRGALASRRGDLEGAESNLTRAIATLEEKNRVLLATPWQYELRDLYQARNQTPDAVKVMAHAIDLLAECGSERGVSDVEEWLRGVDEPALVRMTLSRHIPDHLVEGILTGHLLTIPPRRQEVTILFTDIRDYTTLTEQSEPEDVVEILNEWFVEVTRAIRRHGGVVNQFIGDAIMAMFGVPDSREEASADAVLSALEIRDALAAFNLRRQALTLRQIRIGIGIHSGQAVVGFVGSHLRQTYTAVGDVVNIAARIEHLTKEEREDILISEETEKAQQLFQAAETNFLGTRNVKGIAKSISVYRVGGRRQSFSAVEA